MFRALGKTERVSLVHCTDEPVATEDALHQVDSFSFSNWFSTFWAFCYLEKEFPGRGELICVSEHTVVPR